MTAPSGTSRANESARAERRRNDRRPHVATAFLSSPTGGARVEVVCSDLSRHGIRITLKQAIASGTFHRLELATERGRLPAEVRILSCRAQPDGSFQAHAEFC